MKQSYMLIALAVIVIGGYGWYESGRLYDLFVSVPDGSKTLFTADCSSGNSLTLKVVSFYRPFNLPNGDAYGYGLFYETKGKELALYDNGYSSVTQQSQGWVAPYVGWSFDGQKYTGPSGTNEFSPLPVSASTDTVRVFELPSRTYDRTKTPPEQPPFMNIFLSTKTFTVSEFTSIANCLDANKAGLNTALANLGSSLPKLDRREYLPLKLGGVVYGMPPFSSAGYKKIINELWGASPDGKVTIPLYGKFILSPGQSAEGVLHGQTVAVSYVSDENMTFELDGKKLTENPPGGFQNGITIPNPECSNTNPNCSTQIVAGAKNSDGSRIFIVMECDKFCSSETPR